MDNGKSQTVESLNNMADALQELQLNLEPVRDKALDQKAYFTGYAQCAEQMLKVIVAKMEHLRRQAQLKENGEFEEDMPVEPEDEVAVTPEEEKMEAPLVVDPKPKTRRKKKQPEVKEN